ncbi:hypothetical protein FRB99_008170 [Tulasnella sp. 403]|nr:hypothetical protein FRB99_008170 [Tulasnella sp. 403]
MTFFKDYLCCCLPSSGDDKSDGGGDKHTQMELEGRPSQTIQTGKPQREPAPQMSLASPGTARNGRVSFDSQSGRPESRASQHGSGIRFGPDEDVHDVQEPASGFHTPQPSNIITIDYPSDVKGTMSAIKIENLVPIGRPGAYIGDLFSCKWDDEGGSPVAVRRLRFRALSPSQKKDLEEITSLWRGLNKEYIVDFYGLGKDGSQLLYFVSRWIPDRSLWDYIHDNKDCDRAKYLKSAAVALRYLHNQPTPIAHGNIKAQNILVSGERALLCDIVPPKLSVFSMTGRSQATHRSPEGGISLPSDIYAFGLTIYEAGRTRPFRCPVLQGRCTQPTQVLKVAKPPDRIWDLDLSTESEYQDLWLTAMTCWTEDYAIRPEIQKVCTELKLEVP